MQVIGAAGTNAAGTHVATVARSSGVLRAGGAAPAQTATAPTGLDGVGSQAIDLELIAPSIDELAGAHALAARSSIPIAVENATPSVDEVIRTFDRPVREPSKFYLGKADELRQQLRAGTGDPSAIVRMLDDLDALIRALQRSEEKKQLMKELIRKLMLGLLTPELIAKAKAMGLAEFVQQAIRQMIKGGMISPSEAKAMSTMLSAAGIQVPELDAFVQFHERRELRQEQRCVDFARVARGLQPSVLGLAGTGGGTAGPGSATAGAQGIGMSPDPLVS